MLFPTGRPSRLIWLKLSLCIKASCLIYEECIVLNLQVAPYTMKPHGALKLETEQIFSCVTMCNVSPFL